MFSRIFIEKHLKDHQRIQILRKRFPQTPIKYIEKIEDIFGKAKKPYLQKREDLQLFLGEKRGTLVKKAPDAYGLKGDPHYYFIHAYNCLYECEYCYLQGYFNSPDIVFFINHEEIGEEISKLAKQAIPQTTAWFHAGEFSDSLALSSLSGELPYYFKLFKNLPQAKLELRTKSAHIQPLKELSPQENIIISYSLSPHERSLKTDRRTPPLEIRLKAMKKLENWGHPLAVHLDPIIFENNFESAYEELLDALDTLINLKKIEYFSLGVIRFTSRVYQQVKKNYPHSDLLASNFIKSFDNKIRYPKPMRLWMLGKIKEKLIQRGVSPQKIYLCME